MRTRVCLNSGGGWSSLILSTLLYLACCRSSKVKKYTKCLRILNQVRKFRSKSPTNSIYSIFSKHVKCFGFSISKICKIERSKVNYNCHLCITCSRTPSIEKRMFNKSESSTSHLKGIKLKSKFSLTLVKHVSTIKTTNVVQNSLCNSTNKHNSFIPNHLIASHVKDRIKCSFKLGKVGCCSERCNVSWGQC